MLRHIVMWKVKEEALGKTKLELCTEICHLLQTLPPHITEIKQLSTAINHPLCPADNYDVVLDTVFNSVEDLQTYQVHPKHVEVAGFIKQVVFQRACIDVEC